VKSLPNLSMTRIVLLVATSLLLALGAMMLVAFRGPPPHAGSMTLTEAAGLMHHDAAPPSGWQATHYASDRVPDRNPGEQFDRQGATRIARMLGVEPDHVRLMRALRHGGIGTNGWGTNGWGTNGRGTNGWTVAQSRQGANMRWHAITLSLIAGIFISPIGRRAACRRR